MDTDPADWPALRGDDANLLWVDLEDAATPEMEQVVRLLQIDQRTVEAARLAAPRPAARPIGDEYIVTVLALEPELPGTGTAMTARELDVLLGRNYLLSFHQHPLPFAAALNERVTMNRHVGSFDASYLLYLVLDVLVLSYAQQFAAVEDEVEDLEELMLQQPGRLALSAALRLKRRVQMQRRLVAPLREVLVGLGEAEFPWSSQADSHLHFRNLVARLDTHLQRLDHARDVLTSSYNLYLSSLGYRSNQQLRVLTLVSAVLLPMTVLTGLFGTNFALGEYADWQGFYAMLATMGVIAVGMLMFFAWRRWL
jgi:magnesium transporter